MEDASALHRGVDENGFLDSLVTPVQSGRDVLLDVPHAVVGEVAHQHLPPQVQDLIHHVPKPVEQIPLVLLAGLGSEAGNARDIKRGRSRETI